MMLCHHAYTVLYVQRAEALMGKDDIDTEKIETKKNGSKAIKNPNPIWGAAAVHLSCVALLSSVGGPWQRPCFEKITNEMLADTNFSLADGVHS